MGHDSKIEAKSATCAVFNDQVREFSTNFVQPCVVLDHLLVQNIAMTRGCRRRIEFIADLDVVVDFEPLNPIVMRKPLNDRSGPTSDFRLGKGQLRSEEHTS